MALKRCVSLLKLRENPDAVSQSVIANLGYPMGPPPSEDQGERHDAERRPAEHLSAVTAPERLRVEDTMVLISALNPPRTVIQAVPCCVRNYDWVFMKNGALYFCPLRRRPTRGIAFSSNLQFVVHTGRILSSYIRYPTLPLTGVSCQTATQTLNRCLAFNTPPLFQNTSGKIGR